MFSLYWWLFSIISWNLSRIFLFLCSILSSTWFQILILVLAKTVIFLQKHSQKSFLLALGKTKLFVTIFLGNAQQSRLLIFIYFSSSMSPHRDHASMRLCRFPFLHTDFVLFLDISMIFFPRNAILCLQFLSLMQTPSCWNNQNQIKHLQKHYTTDRYSSNEASTRSLISRRGSH